MHPLPSPNRRLQPLCSLLVMIALCTSLLATLFMVNAALADPFTPTAPEAPGSIAGVVRDEQGAPLAGIKISLFRGFSSDWYPVREVTTTATGAYKVPVLSTGVYRLRAADTAQVYGPLYYPQSPNLYGATDIPVAGNQITNIDLTLAPAARITGVVTILKEITATNGEINVYTQVGKAWMQVDRYVITATGHYTVGPLPAGTFRLCAYTSLESQSFSGCYNAATRVEKATDVILRPGETKSNLMLILGQEQYNGVITGVVTANGIGLPNIQVNLHRNSALGDPLVYTVTNAIGHYSFGGLSDGSYALEFVDPGATYAHTYYSNQRQRDNAALISLVQGAIITNINASLIKGGAIRGTVRRNNGTPVANLLIMVGYKTQQGSNDVWLWDIAPTLTDEEGHYNIQRLWPDTYWVCVGFSVPFGPDCYGTNFPGSPENPGIPVTGGATATGIDIIFGPDFTLYLPTVAR